MHYLIFILFGLNLANGLADSSGMVESNFCIVEQRRCSGGIQSSSGTRLCGGRGIIALINCDGSLTKLHPPKGTAPTTLEPEISEILDKKGLVRFGEMNSSDIYVSKKIHQSGLTQNLCYAELVYTFVRSTWVSKEHFYLKDGYVVRCIDKNIEESFTIKELKGFQPNYGQGRHGTINTDNEHLFGDLTKNLIDAMNRRGFKVIGEVSMDKSVKMFSGNDTRKSGLFFSN